MSAATSYYKTKSRLSLAWSFTKDVLIATGSVLLATVGAAAVLGLGAGIALHAFHLVVG